MRLRVLVIAALVGMLAASTGVAAQSLTPHFPGWERYFAVSWEPLDRRGQPYLSGYIVSSYGVTATRVQLLVDSLDSSGQIVAQRVEWLVGSNLPGFSTTYFEVPIRQPGSRYRVSVFAFDFVQSARIEFQAP
ncbi:MAG TPA: hypothetical protein VGT00_03430 [Methylomirabilota bacterium]|nr:hypothetical protein [Methylomirabilota bacterium]